MLPRQVVDLQAILRDTNHNGFPVVRDSAVGQICLGLIARAHLLALMQRLADAYNVNGSGASSPDLRSPAAAPTEAPREQLHQPLMRREVSRQSWEGTPVFVRINHG
jgi:hypothetical protein